MPNAAINPVMAKNWYRTKKLPNRLAVAYSAIWRSFNPEIKQMLKELLIFHRIDIYWCPQQTAVPARDVAPSRVHVQRKKSWIRRWRWPKIRWECSLLSLCRHCLAAVDSPAIWKVVSLVRQRIAVIVLYAYHRIEQHNFDHKPDVAYPVINSRTIRTWTNAKEIQYFQTAHRHFHSWLFGHVARSHLDTNDFWCGLLLSILYDIRMNALAASSVSFILKMAVNFVFYLSIINSYIQRQRNI